MACQDWRIVYYKGHRRLLKSSFTDPWGVGGGNNRNNTGAKNSRTCSHSCDSGFWNLESWLIPFLPWPPPWQLPCNTRKSENGVWQYVQKCLTFYSLACQQKRQKDRRRASVLLSPKFSLLWSWEPLLCNIVEQTWITLHLFTPN